MEKKDPELRKDIPIPEDGSRVKRYPFSQMAVGESFAAPAGKRRSLLTSAQYYKRRYGKEFTVRQRIEDGVKVIRVWRTQ
jgi:hypothetical protein